MKKIIAFVFLLLSSCGLFARGGHGGGHRGGGHHGGGHAGHHSGRHGGHFNRGGHHGNRVVAPAYQQYQQDPNAIASYDASPEMEATTVETNIDVYTYNNDYVSVRRCCTDSSSNWFGAGPDREWREENIAPDNFSIYRRSDFRPISFTDLAEQPQISGFETSVYTSPK